MENTNKYSGTILEGTYSPIVFTPSDCLSVSISPILSSSVEAGLAKAYYKAQDGAAFNSTSTELSGFGSFLLGFLETILKRKELEQIQTSYYRIIEQANKDFNKYCENHETFLDNAINSTGRIYRWKVVMKDYLLKELWEQLERCGLYVEFKEPTIERLDPRDWPINEGYKLNKQNNSDFLDQWMKYQRVFLFVPQILPLLPIANRIIIKTMRKNIEMIKPIVDLNEKQMSEDLNRLGWFSVALDNIDKIYESILNKFKPIMKDILRTLEYKYQGNVNLMPSEKAEALYKIKTLMKDLCETRIIPKSKDTKSIADEVCNYSNCISGSYEKLRNEIYHNFI